MGKYVNSRLAGAIPPGIPLWISQEIDCEIPPRVSEFLQRFPLGLLQ